jgi:hypothetical protein
MTRDGDVLSSVQVMALADETTAAVVLSQQGIEAIWALDGANDFVHLPLQLLAQGFERLLKVTLALALLERDGELPQPSTFKGKGGYRHDIVKLTDDLVDIAAARPDYIRRPAVRDDIDFIRNDAALDRILQLLTAFGKWSRYNTFEQFLAPEAVEPERDPEQQWRDIEMDVVRSQPEGLTLLASPDSQAEVYRRIAEHLTGVLERFARAIARMWTLGALHEEARRYSGIVGGFLFLRDEDLGASPLPRRNRQIR